MPTPMRCGDSALIEVADDQVERFEAAGWVAEKPKAADKAAPEKAPAKSAKK